jgi:thioredoxin-like negative regulator of GroEL
MITKILKKLVGISNGEDKKIAASLRDNADKLQKFTEEKVGFIKKEYELIREKLDDLRETNYQQGLKFLEKGDLRDAIFRFRVVSRFWPDHFEARYQLAYCLLLHKKPHKAKTVLEHLLEDDRDCDPKVNELLEKVKQSIANAE